MQRIVSFLPSATEILYELKVSDNILAVTHECNYPLEAKSKPKVIQSSFDPEKMSSHEIDNKVVELMKTGKDIYVLDEEVLKKADPDLIIAQGICEVCSPHTREIERAVTLLDRKPEVLILDPKNLDDLLQNVLDIGNKIGRQENAKKFVANLQERIDYIKNIPKISRPKVLCIEWLDPLFTAGHWVPQMIEIAGGINGISSTGDKSRRMMIEEIAEFDPDMILLMPCGFDVKRTLLEYQKLNQNKKWRELKSVKNGDVYALNANDYFSKPGPRIVTGVEILAKILQPDKFKGLIIPRNCVQKIEE